MTSPGPSALPRSAALSDAAPLGAAFAATGAAVLGPPALEAATHAVLLAEARTQRQHASWRLEGARSAGEIAQNNRRAFLGPAARVLMNAPDTLAFLRNVTGLALSPSWSASCYTYYDAPGEYLGEHCDKAEACRIALLVYLDASAAAGTGPGPGLALHVFEGDSSDTPLRLRITGRPNRLVVLNGARQAHLRPPLAAGESLTLLAACYTLNDNAMA